MKNTSETLTTLDNYGVDYLLKLYEYLSYDDYVQALHYKDIDIKKEQAKTIQSVGDFLKKRKGVM